MIGLGRMGGNMVRRLLRAGHECVVYDHSPDAVHQLTQEGAIGADTFQRWVSASGEDGCTVVAAREGSAPATVLSAAPCGRFSSRGENVFSDKLHSTMRHQFGGHVEQKVG